MVRSTVDIVEKGNQKRQAVYDRYFPERIVHETLLKENIPYSPPLFTRTYSGKLEDSTRMRSRTMTWTYI